ncbi:MAG: hypothetical protein JST09_06705 [Bacteroidetes bacterium]|nr:hypothetical protein [Bacteroidota bacterium]MBS1610149.1 hypothetical protein [Bacteroidota bacterium]
MQLRITPAKLISEVQVEFNTVFPFLKLEFFQNKPLQKDALPLANKRIGDYQLKIADGEIEITKEMKVNELERKFKDQFSLNVQVFRRSGRLWLQTTMTDGWTLEKQNEHGKELTPTPKIPAVKVDKNNVQ